MKRLVFIVEGDTEVIFINKTVIPYLYSLGFQNPMNAQTIITNRKQHKKGGVVNYEHLKNDIQRVCSQGNVIVTTFIDYFRLPNNFPGYTMDSNLINEIENGIFVDLNTDILIPYIQKHEIEALMFSDITGFEIVIDEENKIAEIQKIMGKFPNPENINSNPENAPSKRLERIFNYDKVVDSELIFEMINITTIMERCPRFKDWIHKVINSLNK